MKGINLVHDEPMDLSIDGLLMNAKEVGLEVVPKILDIVPGIYLDTNSKSNAREIFRTHPLPRGEKRDKLLKGPDVYQADPLRFTLRPCLSFTLCRRGAARTAAADRQNCHRGA